MKKILLTGGTGFFGKSIKDYFSRNISDYEILTLSRHNADIIGDVRTFNIGDMQFDYIIHAATPARTDINDNEMKSIIIDGTKNIITQAKKCNVQKFLFISSGGVYGQQNSINISEHTQPIPYTTYGISKYVAEQLVLSSGLNTSIARCFAFVGKYLNRNIHFAIGNFIRDALEGNDIIINSDGSTVRSYMYADDLVEWLFAILENGKNNEIYNVGSDIPISIKNLAYLVKDILNPSLNIQILGKNVLGASYIYVPNVTKIKTELNCKLKYDLKTAILESIKSV